MVMFHKNGQGYFEFDYNELEVETSKEFLKEVRWALEGRFVEKVRLYESEMYMSVYVLTPALIKELTFDKETKKHWVGIVTRNVLDLFEGGGINNG